MDDLRKCDCGGDVMHLIRGEEESIIECRKCKQVWDIEQLWNDRPNKHPTYKITKSEEPLYEYQVDSTQNPSLKTGDIVKDVPGIIGKPGECYELSEAKTSKTSDD